MTRSPSGRQCGIVNEELWIITRHLLITLRRLVLRHRDVVFLTIILLHLGTDTCRQIAGTGQFHLPEAGLDHRLLPILPEVGVDHLPRPMVGHRLIRLEAGVEHLNQAGMYQVAMRVGERLPRVLEHLAHYFIMVLLPSSTRTRLH